MAYINIRNNQIICNVNDRIVNNSNMNNYDLYTYTIR